MEKNIQHILEELYMIDSELRNHEIEIAQIIESMIKNKPNTQFDEQFARELKTRVLEKFSHASMEEKKPIFSFFKSRLVYTLGGALATLIIALPVVYLSSNLSSQVMDNSFTRGTRVVKAAANAFGPLDPITLNWNASGNAESAQANAGVANMAFGMGGESAKIAATSLIYNPVYVNYDFDLIGELPQLSETVEVLKRESGLDAAKQYASVLQKLQLGVFDLSKLRNTYVQNFSLAEDRNQGYVVNVDMVGGVVSISENYSKWHAIPTEYDCRMGGCGVDPNRITIDEVPSESELVNIANDFLAEYGIDMSEYAEGKVDTSWKIGYERAEDKGEFYISNIHTVLYQFMINGKPVYEEYGGIMGIRVNINVKEMKVTGVEGIMTKTFSGSDYTGVTDETRLKAMIKKGRMAVYAEPTKTVDVVLENARIGYMQKWQYNESNGNSSELFVPALVLDVKDFESLQSEGLWQNTVIIPLADEMLTELEKQSEEPIHIMPYDPTIMKDAVINPVPMSEPAVEPRM